MFWKFSTLMFAILFGLVFFPQFDSGIEITDLKSQIVLQDEALVFVQDLFNTSITSKSNSCSVPISIFQEVASKMETIPNRPIQWREDKTPVGNFYVWTNGECITKIELYGL